MADAWASHLVGAEVVGEGGLGVRLQRFVRWQGEQWPRLAEAVAGLDRVALRTVEVADRTLEMQFNPARAVSSTAKVDAASVQQRKCFLCAEHLPAEEFGVPFGPDLVVLPNPAPILRDHLVVAHRRHVPQAIRQALGPLIGLAVATEGAFTALYNGPRCGASAPDHLHLQAVAAGLLPEEQVVARALDAGELPGHALHHVPGCAAWSARRAGRAILGFHGAPAQVEAAVRTALEVLGDGPGGDEPMVNVLAVARGEDVVVLLFPRAAHRPRCFFAEGPEHRVVSPGVVDMAGVIVTVRQADFDALDGAALLGVFGEVSVSGAALASIEGELSRRLGDG